MVRLVRGTGELRVKDAKRLRKLNNKIETGKTDSTTIKKIIQELSFTESGLISELTKIELLIYQVSVGLNKQGNSQKAITFLSKYYNEIKSLIHKIHSGARRVKTGASESLRFESRTALGTKLTSKQEGKREVKDSKHFQKLFEEIQKNLVIIHNYVQGKEKINNIQANLSFKILEKIFPNFFKYAEELSGILVDMSFEIRAKIPEDQRKNLKILKKSQRKEIKATKKAA